MVDIDPLRSAALAQREALLLLAWGEIVRDWPGENLPQGVVPQPVEAGGANGPEVVPMASSSSLGALLGRALELIAGLDDELARLLDADPALPRLDRQIERVLAELARRGWVPWRTPREGGRAEETGEARSPGPAPGAGPKVPAEEVAAAERLARVPTKELERALKDLQRREGERIEAQPRLVPLREARQRLVAIQERLENYQALANSGEGARETNALDLTLRWPPWGEVQLRIAAREGRGGGRAPDQIPRPRPGVAVGLSLDSGSLGRIEGEILLWGRVLGVNLRLGGAAERDFVAAGFGELQRRLTALDLEPVLWATLRAPPRGVGMAAVDQSGPGLDLRG